ncbi:hypothetical protein NP493_94g03014 [Ridgeia piscesae]|uniref:Transmembrane protein 101 n=1 Tax=Ridgeia piscesae TaxID=27915 RepID=A0AAD9P818_RIDPI|nr:hypothetical protein NP493_94g03014 [Ridgeia piscesae]
MSASLGSMLNTARWFSTFALSRYPFVNALTFLMLLAERASWEKYPPLEPNTIYIHLALFLICGICMSFNMKKRLAAVIQACQIIVFAITVYINRKLRYSRWLKVRLCHRMVGVAGFFILYSCVLNTSRQKTSQMRRVGETLVGIYLIFASYILYESPEDKRAFLRHVPGGDMFVLYAYIALLAGCAACFLPGYFQHNASQLLIVLVTLGTVMVDLDINYWIRQRGIHYWTQFRLITDNLCIICGLVMCVTSKKRVHFSSTKEKCY